MNKKQKIVLWIGIGIIVLMGIFPPTIRGGFGRGSSKPNYNRLLVNWTIVGVVTGGLFYTLKDKKDRKQEDVI